MTKVVINGCYGGFGLSRKAVLRIRELKADPKWGGPCIVGDFWEPDEGEKVGKPVARDWGPGSEVKRDDHIIIKVIEELGEEANGGYSSLSVVEIPDDVLWHIEEYDGNEWVAEDHRTWS